MAALSVDEALAKILGAVEAPTPTEPVALDEGLGRTLAGNVAALRTQPPFDASAMDGYAVRAADIAAPGAALRVTGTSAAGHRFEGAVGPGEAVRIFTGAPIPDGADAIALQEDASVDGAQVRFSTPASAGRFVRRAGLDFRTGETLLKAGRRLGARDLALAAAMGHATLPVRRRPRVYLIATGDELVRPGEPLGPDQIVASNIHAVGAIARSAGAEAIDGGIAPDDPAALRGAIAGAHAAGADVIVTLGGASVGDHDLVRGVLAEAGMALSFWTIAMRPGKPLLFGRLGASHVLGLPGNPVSSIVCAILFLRPLVRALLGEERAGADPSVPAVLGRGLPANDWRQDYLRCTLATDDEGRLVATAFERQDSSMTRLLGSADGLLVRPAGAPATPAGGPCRVLRFDEAT